MHKTNFALYDIFLLERREEAHIVVAILVIFFLMC